MSMHKSKDLEAVTTLNIFFLFCNYHHSFMKKKSLSTYRYMKKETGTRFAYTSIFNSKI